MNIRPYARRIQMSMVAGLVAVSLWPSPALAQGDHAHAMTAPRQPLTAAQQKQVNALVSIVRDATATFQDPANLPEGYKQLFGCVSGSGEEGAMGVHFVNTDLVFDGGELDKNQPEIVLYEPVPGGGFKITGVDYLVIAADWDAKHPKEPPQLEGQLFHFFDAPNRFGLDPFYTLHVWAWKDNPSGTFTNWNPTVSCEAFSDPN
jgi:hypothetical protein